ncbi:MAG TPA: phytanoyl-CoA dioxygenase family protein [Verrucomicrobiae bacterium]|nr:phytanoyl-CoA dioxygenase family protein [Verrucomicrobiae bacterium]
MNLEAGIQNSEFAKNGFQIFHSVFSWKQCDSLSLELSKQFLNQQKSTKSKIGGVRNLLKNSSVEAIATSSQLISVLEKITGEKLFPVRAIFFDKTVESNWMVPWHQDLAIAVAEKIETPDFAGWSIKDEVLHVHPPQQILEKMVTVRLHLDNCDVQNGALKVISGSHQNGKLNANQIADLTRTKDVVICEVPKGGMVLMRPLLLHSSSPSENPSHRRVLHIEYAADELPNGLKWFERR